MIFYDVDAKEKSIRVGSIVKPAEYKKDFRKIDSDNPLDDVWKGSLVILRNSDTGDLVSGFLGNVNKDYIELSREHPDNKTKHPSSPIYKYHRSFFDEYIVEDLLTIVR